MSDFKVGERAWIIPFQIGPIDRRGYCCTECTIIEPLKRNRYSKTGDAYIVQLYDGTTLYASPRILRRSIPPEQLGIERAAETQEVKHGT